MLLDYRLSRAEILDRLQRESEDAVRLVIVDLENWLEGVEGSTLLLARVLQQDYPLQDLPQLLHDAVEINRDIFGAAIALAATDAPPGFAPYYFRRGNELEYTDLAAGQSDYRQQAWYTDPVASGKAVWVDPYFDAGGGGVLMTTFSVPVYRPDATGRQALYAVVTADVSLQELHTYLQRLRLGNSGFGILLSRSGIILSGRNPDNIMRHYSDTVVKELDQTSWQAMFTAAIRGEVVSRDVACSDAPGRCIIRLGSLESTGWPVGVVYSEDELTAPLRAFELKTALIGLLTLLLMAGAVVVVTRRLTRPITALAQASDAIARGDLDTPLPAVTGGDEVARLVHSFAAMKQDLKSHIADLEAATARRSRLETELAAARDIQMAMLPQGGEAGETDAAYQLWARVLPARSVGGDLYSYHHHAGRLFFAVGDVSDKGIPAALFMARTISLIQQLAVITTDPSQAMARLNNALASGNDNCMFVTLFIGILDLETRKLRFCSAGHTAPSLARGPAVSTLAQEQGPALGLARDLRYAINSLQLEAGDRLAVFTDGVDEAFNDEDQMFGLERCNATLSQSRAQPLAAAGAGLFDAIAEHAGSTPRSDDITVLLLDIAGVDAGGLAVKQEFTAATGVTGRVQHWLRQTLETAALPEQVLGELELVAEELVSNIEKYAGLLPPASLAVTVEANALQVVIEITDPGIPFNPLAEAEKAELGAAVEDAAIGGLGVHLVTALTDRQNYRREGGCNILRVTKLLADPET